MPDLSLFFGVLTFFLLDSLGIGAEEENPPFCLLPPLGILEADAEEDPLDFLLQPLDLL